VVLTYDLTTEFTGLLFRRLSKISINKYFCVIALQPIKGFSDNFCLSCALLFFCLNLKALTAVQICNNQYLILRRKGFQIDLKKAR